MKIIHSLLIAVFFLMGTTVLSAETENQARDFFDRISQKDLIIEDVSLLSPEELKDMVETTHDYCRYGKALRLQNYRDFQAQRGALKSSALVTQSHWDVRHYKIDFGINFNSEIISGYVTVTATSLIDSLTFIELDLLDNMTVDSVYVNGASAVFNHNNDLITITLDDYYGLLEPFDATVYYQGHPTEGGFQGFKFATHSGTDMVTSLSEPYYARSWWPCKDYPEDKADSVDIIITHPIDFVCASNGLLVSIVDNHNGTETTHWTHHYPIAAYLVAIGVTNYAEFSAWYEDQSSDSMPIDFFVFPEKLAQSMSSFPVLSDMLTTLSNLYGEYPFVNEKYGQMHFDWGGAMEHQTNTSISSTAYYESIIVHELGHQWWGDMITCDNWHEIWMNEGFATYTEALWFESENGTTAYHDYMNANYWNSGGSIYAQDTASVYGIFSRRVYDKGSWVLHMLRHHVGDSTFFEILQTYYDDARYKWKTVTTEQFRDLCIEVSGDTRLTEFFQDWIWGEFFPKYRFSYFYEEYEPGQYVAYVHLRQYQSSAPIVFDMPIDLRFKSTSDSQVVVVYNTERVQDFVVYLDSLSGVPTMFTIDSEDWIYCEKAYESYLMRLLDLPLADGAQYDTYLDSVIVKGGTEPYEYAVVAGSLPDGLSLDEQTGYISGTPTQSGEFTFTIQSSDSDGPVNTASLPFTITLDEGQYMLGDVNLDGSVNVSDAVYIINYVFVGGQPPQPILEAGNVNCDPTVNVSDAVYIINYVFVGGSAPGDC